ncbi:MAG TPA: hypothetical protein EYP62_08425, partial [Kiritimatiellae bacterium]|nr:hypothetical protein [Kiritimatiellia bacterium]
MKRCSLLRNGGRRWKLRGAGLFILGLGVVMAVGARDATAETDEEAAALRAEAYQSLIDGDHAASAGRTPEAVAAYSKARGLYQVIQKKFPATDPPVIAYRIRYLNDRIAALSRKEPLVEAVGAQKQGETATAEATAAGEVAPVAGQAIAPFDVVPAGRGEVRRATLSARKRRAGEGQAAEVARNAAYYRKKYEVLLQENQYLHRRLSELQDELESAAEKPGASNLRKRIIELTQENAELHDQLSIAHDKLRAARELLVAQEDLQAQLDEAAAMYEQLMRENRSLGDEVARLSAQLNRAAKVRSEMGNRIAELTAASERWSREKKELQRQYQADLAEQRRANEQQRRRTRDLQARISELQRGIDQVEAEKRDIAARIVSLEADRRNYKARLKDAETRSSELEKRIEELRRQYAAREQRWQKVRAQMEDQLRSEQEAVAQYREQVAALQRRMESLEKDLAFLRDEQMRSREQLTRLRQEKAELIERVDAAGAARAGLMQQIERLRGSLAEAES